MHTRERESGDFAVPATDDLSVSEAAHPPGGAVSLLSLQRSAGNVVTRRMLQSGGMSTPQATSAPGFEPNASVATPQQTAATGAAGTGGGVQGAAGGAARADKVVAGNFEGDVWTQQDFDRAQIDDALADFSQWRFKAVSDWSLASTDEKLKLIDKAVDPGLLWVGPGDEQALEECWASLGG